jgi:hypothetical protein
VVLDDAVESIGERLNHHLLSLADLYSVALLLDLLGPPLLCIEVLDRIDLELIIITVPITLADLRPVRGRSGEGLVRTRQAVLSWRAGRRRLRRLRECAR